MNKIWLIASREYLTRVRKKSFVIMSILGPLMIVGFYAIILWSAFNTKEDKTILVVDESQMLLGKFENGGNLQFMYDDKGLDSAVNHLGGIYDAVLYIPKFDTLQPKGFQLYSEQGVAKTTEVQIRRIIEREIEKVRLKAAGIDTEVLANAKAKITIETKIRGEDGGEEESSATASSIIGIAGGLMIYMFIFLYGVQVMRGVIEEKTSRIVEVIVSSVKPFQLMMGKIIGIAGVGLTQIAIWVALSSIISIAFSLFFGVESLGNLQELSQTNPNLPNQLDAETLGKFSKLQMFSTINLPLILGCFVFYFLFGYLMYASIFGAIGAAVDNETDTQQFMLPITMPLVMSIALSGAIIADPDGSLGFWASLFPLTSPVVMMIRLPFVGFSWELILSMTILVVSFITSTWLAARVYRVGILMYGKKPSYKELVKWMFYKG